MLGLEKIADAFDTIHADVQGSFDKLMLHDVPLTMMGKDLRPGPFTTFMAIPVALTWSLGTFVLDSGKSLMGTLRLGEGVKQGGVGGVVADGLRLLNILPAAGSIARLGGRGVQIIGRAAALRGLQRAVGNGAINSCTPTSIAAATRITGHRITLTVEEAAALAGKKVSPLDPAFKGMNMAEAEKVLADIGAKVHPVGVSDSLQSIEALVQQRRGPVMFGVYWLEKLPLRPEFGYVRSVDRHMMVAFRDWAGRVMVADQDGIRPLAQAAATAAGKLKPMEIFEKALLVEDGAVLQTLARGAQGGPVAGLFRSNAARSAMAYTLGVDLIATDLMTTWTIDARIREKLGRQMRPWANMPPEMIHAIEARNTSPGPRVSGGDTAQQPSPTAPTSPGKPPLPNLLSPTLEADAQKVLAVLPKNGQTTELASIMADAGLNEDRARNAVLRLLSTGLVDVTAWVGKGRTAIPALVKRSGRAR